MDLRTRSRAFFSFIPWVMFLNNPAALPPDGSITELAVARKDCSRPGKVFKAEVASSPASMSKGLGNRANPLEEDEAMLFIFPDPKIASFWMKDVSFPIQIGFFSPLGRLVKKHHMAKEADPANPKRTYSSEKAVLTALEVAPGALTGFDEQQSILCLKSP